MVPELNLSALNEGILICVSSKIDDVLAEAGELLHVLPLAVLYDFSQGYFRLVSEPWPGRIFLTRYSKSKVVKSRDGKMIKIPPKMNANVRDF